VRKFWGQYDWRELQSVIDAGGGFSVCHRLFGIAHATWSKATRNGFLDLSGIRSLQEAATRRYDWDAIQAYHDAGHSVRSCRRHFSVEELARNPANRGNIKRRLLESGALKDECSICGIREWQGKPLSLQIDHINGERLDYRLENLRILCPNCHSQTETFGGRNLAARRRDPS
jgi:5-methylcytosine-specific restriction endonuclease McrA